MTTQVIMPQLGESVVEGTINSWLKNEGEKITEFEPLLEVGSDKVDTEIPAPAGGVLLKILVQAGETVQAGTVIALIGQPGEAVDDLPAPAAHGATAPAHAGNGGSLGVGAGGRGAARISPVVARIAADYGIDPTSLSGTGQGGRVTKKDILAYVEQGGAAAAAQAAGTAASAPAGTAPAPWESPADGDLFKPTDHMYKASLAAASPAPAAPADHVHRAPAPQGQPGEIVPLSKMRRLIADHMVRSKLQTAPHVTTVFEADLAKVLKHRSDHLEDFKARGVNLTLTAYFITAIARALRAHPMVNSQWTDEGILLHRDVNIGMATATDNGLIVPVIRQADELSLQGLARAINDLSTRGRANQLKPDEVTGGTFTLTNHGVSGSLFATPIINQPQTGILGVGKLQKRVVVTEDDAIAIRPMVYITLTFDHRVLDGAAADFFTAEIVSILEAWA